jgi:hypothetical protein
MSPAAPVGDAYRVAVKVEEGHDANEEHSEQNPDDNANGDVQVVRSVAVVLPFPQEISTWFVLAVVVVVALVQSPKEGVE